MRCDELISIFPGEIRRMIESMGLPADGLQEIRVRAGRPVLALCRRRDPSSGESVSREWTSRQRVTREQVSELLAYLAGYSLYAYEDEIRQGFLSLPGGHRVGLAGKTVVEGQKVKTIGEVSSLNIRFVRQVKGCADPILPYLWEDGRLCHTLIVSPPGMGKTTLLRDCIRQISDGVGGYGGRTVGVVDERSEIAGCFQGVPENDVGLRTDVLDGCPKAEGMMMLIRSMSPDVVAVDEIGGAEDLAALRYAMNCGCTMLATAHGSSLEELGRKPVFQELIAQSVFQRYIVLDPGKDPEHAPGRIARILGEQGEELC